ncbi:hybrid sensor histidine kinase/response regulator [Nannocystis radixulma]|uniref:histidine kinase n=1 Tax=Nannocystis radixulma TaxID=2995305 RepID=A0ABT5BKW3_9BACT|nr:PAS domain S-box protein [Nannocystis radixulma]MDC0674790.1 PAS domain S-box protein [Nannocystis radixulma]
MSSRARIWTGYALGLGATAWAVVARLALASSLLERAALMPFVPAVLVAAFVGGLRPGLLTTAASILAGLYFLLSTEHAATVQVAGDWLHLVIFAATAISICWVCEGLWAARRNLSRRAAEQLRQRGEELDRLLELMPAAAWLARDPECRRVVGNTLCCGWLGVASGWNFSVALPPEERRWLRFEHEGRELAQEEMPMHRAIATRTPVTDMEVDLVLVDQTVISLLASAAPLFDAAGAVRGAVVVYLDTRERKQMRNNEERLRLAMEGADLGEWEMNLRTQRAFWSPLARELLGVGPDTPITFELYESRLHPDDLERDRVAVAQCLVTGKYQNEYRIPLVGGGFRWIDARAKLVRDTHGQIVRLFGVVSDITARKEAEEALARSEERLRLILESARDYAIFTVDGCGIVTSWNAGAANVFGYEEREIVGKNGDVLFTPEDRARSVPEKEMRAAQREGRARNERWHLRKDGSRFWGSGLTMPLRDHGEYHGFLKIMRDWTEARRAKEMLERQAEALRQADRRKDEFLATLAHELRNPLAPLRHGLEILHRPGADKDMAERARAMMERQLVHMVHLIDDLLDVSRISRGKIELRKERIALAQVLRTAVETVHPLIESHHHELTLDVPPEPVFVEADLIRLAQVFANLLGNAAKFTPAGGHIWVTVEPRCDEVMVRVKDSGIGIKPEMLPRVFDLFAQVSDALERSQGGLGIGLSLVKQLVEMHGGAVEASSPGLDRGSEFTVRLPIAAAPAVPAGPPAPTRAALEDVGHRVLVVDDNRDAAISLADILGLMGCDTRVAHDGFEGLRAAAEFCPELVFLDIGMPQMNGYETARRMRAEPWGQKLVLVALTGWGQAEDKARAHDAGFDRHIVKPASTEVLEALLAELPARSATAA